MSRTETAEAREAKRRARAVPLAALVAALFLPPVFTGLSLAGQRALIVTVITIVLWTGEILEPGVAALIGVTLLALSGAHRSLPHALRHPHPHLRRAVHPRRRAARRRRRQGRHAGAVLDESPRVHDAADRRHHAGHERGHHRGHVVERLVHADVRAVLRNLVDGQR